MSHQARLVRAHRTAPQCQTPRLGPLARTHRRAREDDGAAAVEFALLTPIMLVLVTGIIAFGMILWSLIAAYHGAREGARLAAVGVDDCAVWKSEVAGRATSVDIESLKLEYPSGASAGNSVLVTMAIDADNSSAGFLAAATSLIPGGSILLPDKFTITAESRAELIGDVTLCSP